MRLTSQRYQCDSSSWKCNWVIKRVAREELDEFSRCESDSDAKLYSNVPSSTTQLISAPEKFRRTGRHPDALRYILTTLAHRIAHGRDLRKHSECRLKYRSEVWKERIAHAMAKSSISVYRKYPTALKYAQQVGMSGAKRPNGEELNYPIIFAIGL